MCFDTLVDEIQPTVLETNRIDFHEKSIYLAVCKLFRPAIFIWKECISHFRHLVMFQKSKTVDLDFAGSISGSFVEKIRLRLSSQKIVVGKYRKFSPTRFSLPGTKLLTKKNHTKITFWTLSVYQGFFQNKFHEKRMNIFN